MRWVNKPVLLVGGGCAGYDLANLYTLGLPILTSWQAKDLIDNWHPLYYGSPGIYGQRAANRVLYEADQIIALGCRLSPWLIGHGGLRAEQALVMCDCDGQEVAAHPGADWVRSDLGAFIAALKPGPCAHWAPGDPGTLLEACHADTRGYINSYQFWARMQAHLRADEVICVDAGCVECPVYQVLRVAPPQRLMTSGGLGEMGCALPAAIGASFARGKAEVLAVVGDGAAMLNLQEMATITHHRLPVKVLVFANDGYAMIRGTYNNLGIAYAGVDRASGITLPDMRKIAHAWGWHAGEIRTWADFDRAIPQLLGASGPALVVVHIDPEQAYLPRVQPQLVDGRMVPGRFDRMAP